jgi:hypothetical protein
VRRAAKPDFSEAFAVPAGRGVSLRGVGSGLWLRAAIGERGLRRRPWRSALTWRYAGERPDGRARVAGTHRPSGATAAINPGWSRPPLDALSGWKLGLVITYFARFINSEIAVLCGWQGAATHGDLLVGSGGTHQEIARQLERGFVGRALRHAQRAALELRDAASGDRLMGTAVSSGADRPITRRRGRRPRAWGEACGPRTNQSRPVLARTRAAG